MESQIEFFVFHLKWKKNNDDPMEEKQGTSEANLDLGPKSSGAQPTHFEPLSPIECFIRFDDGKNFSLAYRHLRFYCPCAQCVDEHTGERVIREEQIPRDIRPMDVQPVGQYALQITWNDQHSTGIYHFDRLYVLCKEVGKAVTGFSDEALNALRGYPWPGYPEIRPDVCR